VTFGSHVTTTKKKAREKAGHAQKHSHGTIAKKKAREKAGHAQDLLPVKRSHYDGYGATSGCACAEHTSGHGT
jgi:hypothetical protein